MTPLRAHIENYWESCFPPKCCIHGKVLKGRDTVFDGKVELYRVATESGELVGGAIARRALVGGAFEFEAVNHGAYMLVITSQQIQEPRRHSFITLREKKYQEVIGLDIDQMNKAPTVKGGALNYFAAVENRDVNRVRELQKTGMANMAARDGRNLTGLMIAATNGDDAMVDALLDLGAEHGENKPRTALHFACIEGREQVVEVLLRRGASPDILAEDCLGGPLQDAAQFGHTGIVRKLLAHGANTELANRNGITALMDATVAAKPEIVSLLICYGADVNAAENGKYKQFTPFMWAAQKGQLENVKIMLFGKPNLDKRTSDGKTVMDVAKEAGQREIVRLLEAQAK